LLYGMKAAAQIHPCVCGTRARPRRRLRLPKTRRAAATHPPETHHCTSATHATLHCPWMAASAWGSCSSGCVTASNLLTTRRHTSARRLQHTHQNSTPHHLHPHLTPTICHHSPSPFVPSPTTGVRCLWSRPRLAAPRVGIPRAPGHFARHPSPLTKPAPSPPVFPSSRCRALPAHAHSRATWLVVVGRCVRTTSDTPRHRRFSLAPRGWWWWEGAFTPRPTHHATAASHSEMPRDLPRHHSCPDQNDKTTADEELQNRFIVRGRPL